jgi:hypothetical protein
MTLSLQTICLWYLDIYLLNRIMYRWAPTFYSLILSVYCWHNKSSCVRSKSTLFFIFVCHELHSGAFKCSVVNSVWMGSVCYHLRYCRRVRCICINCSKRPLLLIRKTFDYAGSKLLRVTPKFVNNWSAFFIRKFAASSDWKFLTTIRNTWKVLKCGGGEEGDEFDRSCEKWRSVT